MAPRIGHVEEMVLLAALRLGDEAYSVPIIEEIHARTGRRVSHGAVFVALRRLRDKELVTLSQGEPRESRGGRPPQLVHVEPAAVDLLRDNHEALRRLWEGLPTGKSP